MRTLTLAVSMLSLATLLAACVTNDNAASRVREEREVVTGSNIPKRDRSGVSHMSREELERMQNAGGGLRGVANPP